MVVRVGVLGASGYTGAELLRLLCLHPDVEVAAVTSREHAGRPLADRYPELPGLGHLPFTPPAPEVFDDCDAVFAAVPHGAAMEQVPELIRRGRRVLDLSADFRIRDRAVWEAAYGVTHLAPELLSQAVYGLPEVNREAIAEATLVAVPGCYPTSVQLGFKPLLEAGLADASRLLADVKSGVSGAGRKASIPHLQAETSENFRAYAVAGHRHHAEICQGLAAMAPGVELTFVPHLVPMVRGIFATLYARRLAPGDVQAIYEAAYAAEPFVVVLPPGAEPATRSVRGSNFCRLAVHEPLPGSLVVLVVIDNLTKGAAGQAVQCLNLMFALPETRGLDAPPLLP